MKTFAKNELVIVYTRTHGGRHKIEIAQIVNDPVRQYDEIATIRQQNYAFEAKKETLFKMPKELRQAIEKDQR